MTIQVALFGNGFARHVMLPGLRHVDGVDVVGIASPNLERVQATAREFDIPFAHSDHRAVLEETSPDLVFVVTPPHRHLDQTVDALDAGCHVVCEKPTAIDADESARMLAAAEDHPQLITVIDHELRLDPRRRQLVEWVREGRFGDIVHMDYVVTSASLRTAARPWSWWNDAEQGGGVLGALGSHAVDALRTVGGEVRKATGGVATCYPTRTDAVTGEPRAATADELAWGALEFESGAMATINLSVVAPERRHVWTVTGSKGCAVLEEQQPLKASFDGDAPRVVPVAEELPSNESLGIPDTDWARNFIRLARAVVGAIESGSSTVDGLATFGDGHSNQLVLDAIHRGGAES